MTCAEKKELQDQCTAACDEFEKATRDVNSSTGILLDLRAKKISLTKPLNVKDWRFEFQVVRRGPLETSESLDRAEQAPIGAHMLKGT